jgi:hypothetical protein
MFEIVFKCCWPVSEKPSGSCEPIILIITNMVDTPFEVKRSTLVACSGDLFHVALAILSLLKAWIDQIGEWERRLLIDHTACWRAHDSVQPWWRKAPQ